MKQYGVAMYRVGRMQQCLVCVCVCVCVQHELEQRLAAAEDRLTKGVMIVSRFSDLLHCICVVNHFQVRVPVLDLVCSYSLTKAS